MACAREALCSTNARANFQRLTRLLLQGGVTLLREVFDSIHPPATLHITLSDPAIQAVLQRARLSRMEWGCLYPSPGVYGRSSDFDITLTFRLLRTISGLTEPATGWNNLPNIADHSLEADLARVKYYRNEVYGHSTTMEISDAEFVGLWREISEALLRIAASISDDKRKEWNASIHQLLHAPLTPHEEMCVEELCCWYRQDMKVRGVVEDNRSMLNEIRLQLQTMHDKVQRSNQQIEIVCIQLEVSPQNHPQIQASQQNHPTETDIWGVILSFKSSFRLLFQYLITKLNVRVQDIDMGSLLITVECSSSQVLEGLWRDYKSGHLAQVAQETLITDQVLGKLKLSKLMLETVISEEEYEKGIQAFKKRKEKDKEPKEPKPGKKPGRPLSWKDVALGMGAGAVAVAATPLALSAAGFTSAGIAAGSAAAAIQSTVYGGATTGAFAALQSAGMAGISSAASATVGGVTGAAAVLAKKAWQKWFSSGTDEKLVDKQDLKDTETEQEQSKL